MDLMLRASHLLMLAGGSIDGDKKPLDVNEYLGVTFAGLGIVIAALAILVILIFLFGKLFDALDGAKQRKETKAAADKAPKTTKAAAPVKAAPPAPAPAPAPAPVQAAEDDDEVIAVISAVIAMMSEADGKAYRVKSVKPVNGFGGRSAWAMDGRRSNVSPF